METTAQPSFEKAPQAVSQATKRRWLLAYDCYNVASNATFTSAVWMVYLALHGYSPLIIGLLETLFHVTKFVAEIPTGIFADLVGRRRSLLIFCGLDAISTLLFLTPSLPLLVLSFALSGLAFAFRGGADEALLWTLAGYIEPEQQTRRYSRLISRMYMVGLIGGIAGTSLGGFLGHLLEALPFITQGALMAIGILPLLLLPEQRVARHERTHPLRHFWLGLRAAWRDETLLALLLLSGLTEGTWQTVYFFNQLYLHGLGFALGAIGLVVAASQVTSFIFSGAAPLFIKRLPTRLLVPLFVLLQIAGLLLMSIPQTGPSLLGFLLFFQAAQAVLAPALSTYTNARSPEAQRATVLSLQTGLFSAAMIVLFPLFGLSVSHISYSSVYQWSSLALAAGGLVILGLKLLLGAFRKRG